MVVDSKAAAAVSEQYTAGTRWGSILTPCPRLIAATVTVAAVLHIRRIIHTSPNNTCKIIAPILTFPIYSNTKAVKRQSTSREHLQQTVRVWSMQRITKMLIARLNGFN